MKVLCRPGHLPSQTTHRRHGPFDSPWPSTISLLTREARQLGTTLIVIELDLTERDIRNDGWPRNDARPATPAVAVYLDSRHGDLRYACDTFVHWQDNVRAVALALEALRKVERYGVGGRGEQYRGWLALESGDGAGTVDDAAQLLLQVANVATERAFPDGWWRNPGDLVAIYRKAAKRSHPDAPAGSDELFREVERAYRTLQRAA